MSFTVWNLFESALLLQAKMMGYNKLPIIAKVQGSIDGFEGLKVYVDLSFFSL